jgi:hypothetical protein
MRASLDRQSDETTTKMQWRGWEGNVVGENSLLERMAAVAEALTTLLDLRGNLAVDVLQRDCVNVGELDVIEGHRESLVVH